MTGSSTLFSPAAKGVARDVLRHWGRASWRSRLEPDFIIGGAQRCGTTSLFRTLAQHPDVVVPLSGKGVHYFDTADSFARGRAWYVGHFPIAATARIRTRGRARTGEASPYYVFHPLAAARIAQTVPDAKMLVLVRDPVERAFSAWKQERARGFEDQEFEAALDLEGQRLEGEVERILADPTYQSFSHQHHAYVARGRYAEQLRRVQSVLPAGALMVVETDDVLTGRGQGWSDLLNHLGLRHWEPQTVPRANARPSTPMPAHVRRRLESEFEESDTALTEFLGRPPTWRA